MIDEVISDRAAWIVIHEDDNGMPGEVIGRAHVSVGVTQLISVGLTVQSATRTLYAILYEDAGELGKFEVSGTDEPLIVYGRMVIQPFQQRLDLE